MSDFDNLLRENTEGLMFREADNLSDWTVGFEWQLRCDVCGEGVWPEDTREVPGQTAEEHYCETCAFQAMKDMAISR